MVRGTQNGRRVGARGGAAVWAALAVAGTMVALPAASARAQGAGMEGFLLEVPVGLGTPIAEGGYERLYDPSLWLGLNLGYLFALGDRVTIGPALDVQYSIGNVQSDWHHGDGYEDDLYLGRLRLIGGARLTVGFGSAFLLMRLGLGLDYVHASWDDSVYREDDDDSDVTLGIVTGLGMGYMVADRIGIEFLLDFPVGFHDEDRDDDPVDWDDEMIDILASLAVSFVL